MEVVVAVDDCELYLFLAAAAAFQRRCVYRGENFGSDVG